MRATSILLAAVLSVILHGAFAGENQRPGTSAHPRTVKCQPTIEVWVDVDDKSIQTRVPISTETKKHVTFHLIGSSPYRGEAVACNYATRRRDVTTSYSVRCWQPRKEAGSRHAYLCG